MCVCVFGQHVLQFVQRRLFARIAPVAPSLPPWAWVQVALPLWLLIRKGHLAGAMFMLGSWFCLGHQSQRLEWCWFPFLGFDTFDSGEIMGTVVVTASFTDSKCQDCSHLRVPLDSSHGNHQVHAPPRATQGTLPNQSPLNNPASCLFECCTLMHARNS